MSVAVSVEEVKSAKTTFNSLMNCVQLGSGYRIPPATAAQGACFPGAGSPGYPLTLRDPKSPESL